MSNKITIEEIIKLIENKSMPVEAYNMILEDFEIAKKKMAEGDLEKSMYIKKASHIIFALSLSVRKTGELADNLKKLYSYITSSLSRADAENNMEEINNAERVIKTLKESFEKL